MREYLKGFLEEFEYSQGCQAAMLDCYDRIMADGQKREILSEALEAYRNNKDVKFAVLQEYVNKLCEGFCIHEYTVWLMLYLLMTKRLTEHYNRMGISPEVRWYSFLDLKVKSEECIRVKGIHGTFSYTWFPNLFRLKRFAFGRLQFEEAKFQEEHFTCSCGLELDRETEVLAVHIPRVDMPLSKENCDASYEAAAEFYKDRFKGDYAVFTCNSWMLYPGNSEILHEKANTRRFGEEFEKVTVNDDAAGDYPNAWRIFDVEFTGNVSELPEDTRIRKAFKEHMLKGGVTGRAYGVKLLPKKH